MVSTFDQDTAQCLSLTALYEELSDSVVISLFPFFYKRDNIFVIITRDQTFL